MPIQPTDIEIRYSAPTATAGDSVYAVPAPGMSLGGYASRALIPNQRLNSLFPPITSVGGVDYQCVFVVNRHPYYTLSNAVAWIITQNPNWQTSLLGVDLAIPSDVGSSVQQAAIIPDRYTQPAGSGPFTVATTKVNGVQLGNLLPSQAVPVWIARTNMSPIDGSAGPTAPVSLFGAGTLSTVGTLVTGNQARAGSAAFSGLGNLAASAMTAPHALVYLGGIGQLVAVGSFAPLTYLPRPIPGSVTMRVEGFSPA